MFHWQIKFWNLMNIGVLVCWTCLKTLVLRNFISALTCFTTICRTLAVCVFYKVPLMCLTPFLFGGLEGDSFLVMAFFKRNFVIELLRGLSPFSCKKTWCLLLHISPSPAASMCDMCFCTCQDSICGTPPGSDPFLGITAVVRWVVIVNTFLFRNHSC